MKIYNKVRIKINKIESIQFLSISGTNGNYKVSDTRPEVGALLHAQSMSLTCTGRVSAIDGDTITIEPVTTKQWPWWIIDARKQLEQLPTVSGEYGHGEEIDITYEDYDTVVFREEEFPWWAYKLHRALIKALEKVKNNISQGIVECPESVTTIRKAFTRNIITPRYEETRLGVRYYIYYLSVGNTEMVLEPSDPLAGVLCTIKNAIITR